jgi:hypothetical protein
MHTDFICYTIENYKNEHHLDGKTVIVIFDKFAVFDYIKNCYEYLHTVSSESVVWNIDEYIRNKELV